MTPLQTQLLPRPLEWIASPTTVRAKLERLAGPLRLEQPATAVGVPSHFRLVEPQTNRPSVFIRVVSMAREAEVDFNVAVSEHLAKRGLSTPQLLSVTGVDEATVALCFQWIDGQYPTSPELDYDALGYAVAGFQLAVRPLSQSYPLRQETSERLERLKPTAAKAPSGGAAIDDAVRDFERSTRSILEDAVPSHGDLNPANILVGANGFTFLDFEDMLHMHVWWGFDVSKLIERLILTRVGTLGPVWANTKLQELLTGYFAGAGIERPPGLGVALINAMRWHLALSFLVLAQRLPHASLATNSEVAKLSILADLIDRKAPSLMDAIR